MPTVHEPEKNQPQTPDPEDTDFLRAHDGTFFSPWHVVKVRRAIASDGVWARIEADLADGSTVILSETADLRWQVDFLNVQEGFWLGVLSQARQPRKFRP